MSAGARLAETEHILAAATGSVLVDDDRTLRKRNTSSAAVAGNPAASALRPVQNLAASTGYVLLYFFPACTSTRSFILHSTGPCITWCMEGASGGAWGAI